ncbi:hypothetical protein F4779DRAFT_616323 [Xylariaceae sp. FL0662B]|nr:hypothetical protein F4779DRAFT_616323 [Xylariaceae sp. FL0662B]
MPEIDIWHPLKIPQQILNKPANAASVLLGLPTELLVEIFRQCSPTDQVCLALASRRLAQVAVMIPVETPCRFSPGGCPVAVFARECLEPLLKRLRPLDARGRPKRTFDALAVSETATAPASAPARLGVDCIPQLHGAGVLGPPAVVRRPRNETMGSEEVD